MSGSHRAKYSIQTQDRILPNSCERSQEFENIVLQDSVASQTRILIPEIEDNNICAPILYINKQNSRAHIRFSTLDFLCATALWMPAFIVRAVPVLHCIALHGSVDDSFLR
jgi:hypothetical protein